MLDLIRDNWKQYADPPFLAPAPSFGSLPFGINDVAQGTEDTAKDRYDRPERCAFCGRRNHAQVNECAGCGAPR